MIKLPQTRMRKKENVLLAVGLLLLLTGLFVYVGRHESSVRLFAFRPLIVLGLGIILLFTSLAFTGNSLSLFFGLFFLQIGGILLVMDAGILTCGFSQIWPTIMIATAFSLFPAGLYKARRVRTVYLFPAIMMLLLGIIFLLFSFRVFPVPFKEFVVRCWPLMVMLSGGGLVVIFFVQQLNANHFPYLEDDSLVDGDEK